MLEKIIFCPCRDFDQQEQDMPHAVSVTPAEQEAIERVCSRSYLLFVLLSLVSYVIITLFSFYSSRQWDLIELS